MPTGVAVRPFTTGDIGVIAALFLDWAEEGTAWGQLYCPGRPARAGDRAVDTPWGAVTVDEEWLLTWEGSAWVAEVGGSVIGFVHAGEEPVEGIMRLAVPGGGRVWEIHQLYVRPSRRGDGIGSALLLAALAEGDRRGLPSHLLTADRRFGAIRRFYERHGFQLLSATMVRGAPGGAEGGG